MPDNSIANTSRPSQPGLKFAPLDMRVIFGFWIVVCIIFIARNFIAGSSLLIGDTDDAMRLVVVRDFISGQGWFDHLQYRLNTPFGAEIHWSRLIDVPIAAIILILQPFFGDFSFTLAAWIWPLFLLLILFILSVRISTWFVGPDGLLPGLVLPILSATILVEFSPGRVDHHSVQIILVLALLYCCVRAWSAKSWALPAGIIAATSLAIGMEALPQVITAIMVFGLFYVVDLNRKATTRLFGISFGGAALVNLALALPLSRWSEAACDALSLVHLYAAMGVGLTFVILSFLPLKTRVLRLIVGGALGGSMGGALLMVFPHCAGGPYGAIDPWLAEHWLVNIAEAKSLWRSLMALPGYTTGIIIPPIAALLILSIFILKKQNDKRAEWMILGVFLITGILVVMAQVRGARLVAGMVAPVGAWAIITMRHRYLENQSIPRVLGLLGAWIVFSGMVIAMVMEFVVVSAPQMFAAKEINVASVSVIEQTDDTICLQPETFEDIASLPPERIMAPVDLGAHLLLFTPHAVVGAPYHRNQKGILDTFGFFNRPLEDVKEIIEQRGISLIVICPYLPEMNGIGDTDENSFVRLFKDDNLPDWLHDVTLPGSILDVYAVVN